MMTRLVHKDEVDLIDYLRVLYKNWVLIFLFVLVGVLSSASKSYREPVVYEASATFIPITFSPAPSGEQSGIKTAAFVLQPQYNLQDLIVSLLESRKMGARIIEQLSLKDVWKTSTLTGALGMLQAATHIQVEKRGLVRLSVQLPSPELSAQIANAYVDNLDYFNTQMDLGVMRQIVQVIDRATVPEESLPREMKKKILAMGFLSFVFGVFVSFLVEFFRQTKILERLKRI